MTKRNKWIFAITAFIFIAIGLYSQQKKSQQQQAESKVVNELFATSLSDLSGQKQSLAQWKGKTLVVNFWATWCNPCVEEMPELSALQNTLSQKNIQIIGIGIDSTANITEFSSKHKIAYPLYVAETEGVEFARKFGNQAGGLPFTVLIEPTGEVKRSYLGRLKLEELKRDLKLQ
jgi:peroxiredoxin